MSTLFSPFPRSRRRALQPSVNSLLNATDLIFSFSPAGFVSATEADVIVSSLSQLFASPQSSNLAALALSSAVSQRYGSSFANVSVVSEAIVVVEHSSVVTDSEAQSSAPVLIAIAAVGSVVGALVLVAAVIVVRRARARSSVHPVAEDHGKSVSSFQTDLSPHHVQSIQPSVVSPPILWQHVSGATSPLASRFVIGQGYTAAPTVTGRQRARWRTQQGTG
ncbi:MAG: hypothetical protein EOP06_28355, partial [Proteobacteria bacterium]